MNDLVAQLDSIQPAALRGSVVRTEGMMTAVAGLPAPVGAIVEIRRQSGPSVEGEVIGFRDELTLVYPFSSLLGVRRGTPVRLKRTSRYLRVGEELLGRVIDARGRTTDHLPKPSAARSRRA